MSKNTSLKDTVLFVLGAYLLSFLFLGYLRPEQWFFHTIRLWNNMSSSMYYNSMFMLVSHFFHGGIQLWSRFSQMNDAYYVLSYNLYSIENVVTVFIFICLSPFISLAGEGLYHIHLISLYGIMLLIRTVGTYILLRKLVSNKIVIFVGIVSLNVFLTYYMEAPPDWMLDGVFSFFPMLLYFILCFFEELRLRSFLLVVLVMTLTFVNSPLFTLGYYYQVVHGVILACVVSFVLQRGWRKLQGRSTLPPEELMKNLGLALGCFLILLPYAWWIHSLTEDFYIHHSGLGGTHGRLSLFFNFSGYFYTEGRSFANPLEFIGTSLNYHPLIQFASWPFIGGSVLFFSLAALLLSKDRRKYIFAAAIFFILLLNTCCYPNNIHLLGWTIHYSWTHPQDFWRGRIPFGYWLLSVWLFISSIAHWINAITNPLNSFVRSFQIPAMLMVMLLAPLMAMGLESCFHWWNKRADAIHYRRRWLLLAFGVFVLVWDLSGGTKSMPVFDTEHDSKLYGEAAQNLGLYILCLTTTFLSFMLMAEFFSSRSRWLGWTILAFAFVSDFACLKACLTYDNPANYTVVPIRLKSPYTHQAFIPDYPNPRILPFREYFNPYGEDILPLFDHDSFFMYGDFYRYVPMGRLFRPWDIYEPRHISYKDLYPDMQMQQYLTENPRTISFADYAFDSRYLDYSQIVRLGLTSRVIMADEEPYNRSFIKTIDRVRIPPTEETKKFYNVALDAGKARLHKAPGGWEYQFDLPEDFPAFLSTSILSYDDTSWKLIVNDRELMPMQGKLTTPYTFDVQNVRERKVAMLLPEEIKKNADINLQVKLPDRILRIWKNNYDDLGFTYEAPKDGWLVFNYPYDKKWELTIDNYKTPLSRVNRYFIGVPILAGEHQVLLRYWPHTSLRFWIFISMALSVICFGGTLYYCIRREPLFKSEVG